MHMHTFFHTEQKRPEISTPVDFEHTVHVGFDLDTGEFTVSRDECTCHFAPFGLAHVPWPTWSFPSPFPLVWAFSMEPRHVSFLPLSVSSGRCPPTDQAGYELFLLFLYLWDFGMFTVLEDAVCWDSNLICSATRYPVLFLATCATSVLAVDLSHLLVCCSRILCLL